MVQELRLAIRFIWRSKLFALTTLVAFSFGIGSTATVFSIIDAVLLRPATFADPASMVSIQSSYKNQDWDNILPSVFDVIRSRTELFSQVIASRTAIFTVTHVAVPDQMFGVSVSGNFFSMLAARPWRGRLLSPEDNKTGAPPVVLLSYKAWRRLFAEDPDVIGKTAVIDGDVYTVIGVMPSDFVLPIPNSASMLWTVLKLTPAELSSPEARSLQVSARLRPSVTLARAQERLDRLASTLHASDDDRHDGLRLRASQLRYETDANQKLTLWLAMGMVSGLLLIGCGNLSSILLARAIGRRRDYAIRLATGASRLQLIRQALLEVFLLAFAALPVACVAAYSALDLIRNHLTAVGSGIPNLVRIQLNSHSLLFSFAITLLCALICGLFPAISTTSVDVGAALRETGTLLDGRRSTRRFLHFLLGSEACISLLLLLTSGLLVRSLTRIMSDNHGLRPEHVLTLRLPTGSWQGLSTQETPEEQQRRTAKYLELLRQAQETRGAQAAALASSLPLSHTEVRGRFYAPGHRDGSGGSSEIMPITQAVTRDYFRAMGIPVLSGHTFEVAGRISKLPTVLVNQAFVRQYFSGENPVGKFLHSPDSKTGTQIIGVVKDSPHLDLTESIEPEVYSNFEQTEVTPFLTGLVVRSQNDPQSLSRVLRNALSIKDADQAIVEVKPLQTLVDENTWQPRFSAWLSSTFAGVAVFLCGIGIYGVVAYVTASRRRDFGIRVALGAEPGNLLRLSAMQSLTPILMGSCFGLLCFYWTSKWISSLLYKISPFDLGNSLSSVAILLLIALAAVAGPAIRAARVDPAIALRYQ